MPTRKNVNNLTVVHKKSSGLAIAFPDVCKTPTPGGPVPIPYPNVAQSTSASKTSKKVKVDGEGVMLKGSNFSMSSGDEAGTAGGGVISSKIKGKAEFLNYSFDVKFEGKPVARLTDPMSNNAGSSANSQSPAEVQPPAPALGIHRKADQEACDKLKDKWLDMDDPEVRKEIQTKHGMVPEHADRISKLCKQKEMSVTFRATNPKCLKKIMDGYPAKPLSVKAKTITKERLKKSRKAVIDKVANLDLEGFVGWYSEVTGELLGVMTESGPVSLDKISDVSDIPKNTYTGDYDAHDMFGKGGERLPSPVDERKFQKKLNKAIRRGKDKDMVRHGPQSTYREYCERNDIEPNPKLLLPDVSEKEPLLAFDENGEVYQLHSEEDLRNYYKCKGLDVPEEWDGEKRKELEKKVKQNDALENPEKHLQSTRDVEEIFQGWEKKTEAGFIIRSDPKDRRRRLVMDPETNVVITHPNPNNILITRKVKLSKN